MHDFFVRPIVIFLVLSHEVQHLDQNMFECHILHRISIAVPVSVIKLCMLVEKTVSVFVISIEVFLKEVCNLTSELGAELLGKLQVIGVKVVWEGEHGS